MCADQITNNEALQVINDMLARTRRKTAVAGEFFIAWGILIFLATGIMWLLHELQLFRYIWINWLAAMLAGVAWSAWKMRHLSRAGGPVSYSDRAVRGLWTVLCLAFFLVNFIGPLADGTPEQLYLIDAVLAGSGLWITGVLLQVRRFAGFALIWWLGGVAAAFLDFPLTAALFMIIILLGALWPGWVLIRLARREG